MNEQDTCAQDVGAPCCSKPQVVCFRSLAELKIEPLLVDPLWRFRIWAAHFLLPAQLSLPESSSLLYNSGT